MEGGNSGLGHLRGHACGDVQWAINYMVLTFRGESLSASRNWQSQPVDDNKSYYLE